MTETLESVISRYAIIRRFLDYAFKPIDYQYDGLTAEEKKLCTRQEFNRLVNWLQE